MFSKSCEYGLRATIYIAKQSLSGNKIGAKKIAKAIGSPEAFTGKILQELTKNNIVKSIKGPYGGFLIEEVEMKKIKLKDVIRVLDGNKTYSGCGLGLELCSEKEPCFLHFQFKKVRRELKKMLNENSIYDVALTNKKFRIKA